MKSILLCEGRTDAGILKYYMEKVNDWQDDGPGEFRIDKHFSRKYQKKGDSLTIAATGGSSQIDHAIKEVIQYNKLQYEPEDYFSKIIIVTDHDDETSASEIKSRIETVLQNANCDIEEDVQNNKWFNITYLSKMNEKMASQLLLLLIPFEETGAIETFILNVIGKEDPYDRIIIDSGNSFIESVDPDKRYLNHRRIVTKAKYEVFFSVRATAEKHNDRGIVMKSIPWEEYQGIQSGFARLGEI